MLFINEIINRKYNTTKGYLYFIDLIKEKYPTFKINEDNLKNLSIVEMDLEYFKQTGYVGVYFAEENEIRILNNMEGLNCEFSEDELIDTFLHEFVHALTSKVLDDIILEGINQRMKETGASSYFFALNEGITQFIVNDLLEAKSDAYPFETHLAEQLAIILDKDKLIELYSNNETFKLLDTLKSINPEFDEREFIINIAATSKILQGEFINGEDLLDKTRGTLIEEKLINLYLLSEKTRDSEFKEVLIDEEIAKQILIESIAYAKNKNLTIEDVGFMDIEKVKEILVKKGRK